MSRPFLCIKKPPKNGGLAGAEGLEPSVTVLDTVGLAANRSARTCLCSKNHII